MSTNPRKSSIMTHHLERKRNLLVVVSILIDASTTGEDDEGNFSIA